MSRYRVGDILVCVENPVALAAGKAAHPCYPGSGWTKHKVITVRKVSNYEDDEVYWPATGGNGIWGKFLEYNSKFRKGDSVTNGYITLKIENKLVNEDEWWLVSRKKLI